MARIIIALGSSLGDRLHYLKSAKDFLSNLCIGPVSVSPIYETEPVGNSKNHYLNAVLSGEMSTEPLALLEELKSFEMQMGRDPKAGFWTDRVLDLDIIDFGGEHIQTQRLTIPHPHYAERWFVLYPLRDLFPEWRDPLNNRPIDEMLASSARIDVKKTNLKW